jgi:hypothetical protein
MRSSHALTQKVADHDLIKFERSRPSTRCTQFSFPRAKTYTYVHLWGFVPGNPTLINSLYEISRLIGGQTGASLVAVIFSTFNKSSAERAFN